MTDSEQKRAAEQFVKDWMNRGDEKQDTQQFWTSLLQKVFGVEEPEKQISFEKRVIVDNMSTGKSTTKFIDAYLPETRVLIEQKSADIDLRKGEKQSDGSPLNPYQQARRYGGYLSDAERPRWIITCNFREFQIHDMNNPNGEPEILLLKDLAKEYNRLSFMVQSKNEHIQKEMEVSIAAGKIVGQLYDAFAKQYKDPESEHTLRSLNPETRRKGGMHYTSIENIHKVIDPLFLEGLKKEFAEIGTIAAIPTRKNRLQQFQNKLAGLTFLDPACGSGNFLTETYLSLRRLENQTIAQLIAMQKGQVAGQIVWGGATSVTVKVSISHFYGIEINDFAVTVAKTALWIAESQMLKETEAIIQEHLEFLPLKTNAYIIEGNALRLDWESIIPKRNLSYIMGNPPFVGARLMSAEQKADINEIFSGWKNAGNLDYVCCWYKKCADMMEGTHISSALVSTNSVVQGESVANLWKPLPGGGGIQIQYAYRTFRWDSEAVSKAHVHCVIIGFSAENTQKKRIYTENGMKEVSHINAYLMAAPDVFVESRNKPLCNVPQIGIGNKPIDGGFYLFSQEEMNEFVKKEPAAEKYFHPWYGAREFINNQPRYCLYLANCSPVELREMPESLKRVEEVKQYRLKSSSAGTRKLAESPTRFHVTNIPKGTYIVIPQVSSERRKYIPMGYMDENVMCSDKVRILPEGTLYHFGVLESNVHMAWMRTVCCRLKSDYSYTVNDVYNNFPWPTPTDAQKARIEQTAQGILDARALYPDCSLADLYDETTMPPELRKAHQQNDRAVMDAYGFVKGTEARTSESACVAELMKLYQKLSAEKNV